MSNVERLHPPVRAFLGRGGRLLIDGKLVHAEAGATIPVIDPATGPVITAVAAADSCDVDRALRAARRAFDRRVGPAQAGRPQPTVVEGRRPDREPCRRAMAAWKLAPALAALVSEEQLHRVTGLIEQGRREGAAVQSGGERFGSEGYFIRPTVLTGTNARREHCPPPRTADSRRDGLDQLPQCLRPGPPLRWLQTIGLGP